MEYSKEDLMEAKKQIWGVEQFGVSMSSTSLASSAGISMA